MSNIKYFGFAKESASVPVLGLILQQSDEEEIRIEVSRVLSQLKMLEMRVDERQKIKSAHGCWHCKKDSRGMLYLTLCSSNYPERHIYAAINQVRDHLVKLGDYQSQPDSTLKLHARQTLEDICKSYQNLKSFDKITAVKTQVQEVTSRMRQNTQKLVQNIANVQNLQKKSDHLKQNALLFETTANDLQNVMYRRNCKVKIIIGVVIVALIILIIVPIATKQTH